MGKIDPNKTRLDALRKLWRDGVGSGDGGPLDVEALKRRGRERLAARKLPG